MVCLTEKCLTRDMVYDTVMPSPSVQVMSGFCTPVDSSCSQELQGLPRAVWD